MIFVRKQGEPEWYKAWIDGTSPDWKPVYSALNLPTKSKLKETLVKEQGQTCCYCGGRITEENSHIEHFRPQGDPRYRHLSVTYINLFASCIKETVKGKPLHCGHAKGESFDENLFISPLDPACESFFAYTYYGDISPASENHAKATYMISLLRLNCPSLRHRRRATLEGIFSAEFIGSVTEEELRVLRDSYRQPNENGVREEFGQVLTRFIDQLLPPDID